jgi:prepilin-type N-terminal cleavage/methylation domain-containing protein
MRRGFTIIEVMVAAAIGSVALGCLFALWQLGTKMHRASQSTIGLQAALTMTEALFSDMRQIGIDPATAPYVFGPAGRPPGAAGTSLSFYKVSFQPSRIDLLPVRYRTMPSPGGNRWLVRDERKRTGVETQIFKTCPLQAIAFDATTDQWGNTFLRAAVRVLDEDRPPGRGAVPERVVHQQVLVRIPVPDRLGDPEFAMVNVVTRTADLLPP